MSDYSVKFSYLYYNDTTLEYTPDNGVELTTDLGNPYGCSEVMVSNGDACMEELMLELHTEISAYLENAYAGSTPKAFYDGYPRQALCAFQAVLAHELGLE